MVISAQQLTIYLYSAHRAVIFAIAQLSCSMIHPCDGQTERRTDRQTDRRQTDGRAITYTRYILSRIKTVTDTSKVTISD